MKYVITLILLAIGTLSFGQVTPDSSKLSWVDGTHVIALQKGESLDSLTNLEAAKLSGPTRLYNEVTGDFYVRNPEDSTFILVTPTFDTLAPSSNVLPLSKYHIYHNTSDTTIWISYGTDSTDWIQISN